jgi:hypothetical protein
MLWGPTREMCRSETPKGAGRLGQLAHMASGIATDSFGRLYVSEWRDRVQVRDVNGKWYELGHSEVPLGRLRGIAVDRNDVVYLLAAIPPRILRWTPQPQRTSAGAGH